MDALPVEVVLSILSLLSDKAAARLVCRQWRLLINSLGCQQLYRLPTQETVDFAQAMALYKPRHVNWGAHAELDLVALAPITKLDMYYVRQLPRVWPTNLVSLTLINIHCDLDLSLLQGIVELTVFDAMVFGTCSTITTFTATSLDTIDLRGLPNLKRCCLSHAMVVDYDVQVLAQLDQLEFNQCSFNDNTYIDALVNIPHLKIIFDSASVLIPARLLAHTLYVGCAVIPETWALPNVTTLTLENVCAEPWWDLSAIPLCTNIRISNAQNIINTPALNAKHITWQNSCYYQEVEDIQFNPSMVETLRVVNITPSGMHLDAMLMQFIHLRVLDININAFCNQLTDLPHLEELTLRTVGSLRLLSNFPRLQYLFLNLRALQQVDIMWSTMPQLHTVHLIGSCVVPALPLVQKLVLDSNAMLETLPPVSSMLKDLRLYRCHNLQNVRNAAHVPRVLIHDCPLIADVNVFVEPTTLTMERMPQARLISNLHACDTLVLRFMPLRTLPTLSRVTSLDMSSTNVVDLSFLLTASNLRHLCIDKTLVSNLDPLQHLPVLRSVVASRCDYIQDVTPLRRVWKIVLSFCANLTSIMPLLHDAHVLHLNVEGCPALLADQLDTAMLIIPELRADY